MNQLTTVNQEREITPPIMDMIRKMASDSEGMQSKRYDTIKKLIFCHENNLPYSLALTGGIFIVHSQNGEPRLGIESTIIRSQLRRSQDYDYEILKSDDAGATVRILRHVDGQMMPEGEFTFGEEDAKKIVVNKNGMTLNQKDSYKNYPQIMYVNRAIAMAQRIYAPDIFNQTVYIDGEVPETNQPKIINMPTDTVQEKYDMVFATFGKEAVYKATGGQMVKMDEAYLDELIAKLEGESDV